MYFIDCDSSHVGNLTLKQQKFSIYSIYRWCSIKTSIDRELATAMFDVSGGYQFWISENFITIWDSSSWSSCSAPRPLQDNRHAPTWEVWEPWEPSPWQLNLTARRVGPSGKKVVCRGVWDCGVAMGSLFSDQVKLVKDSKGWIPEMHPTCVPCSIKNDKLDWYR